MGFLQFLLICAGLGAALGFLILLLLAVLGGGVYAFAGALSVLTRILNVFTRWLQSPRLARANRWLGERFPVLNKPGQWLEARYPSLKPPASPPEDPAQGQ